MPTCRYCGMPGDAIDALICFDTHAQRYACPEHIPDYILRDNPELRGLVAILLEQREEPS